MEKLTQAELLSEGFWDAFKQPFRSAAGLARGAVAGAAKALDYTLPELTKPLHGAEAAIRDVGDAAKKGYERYSKGLKEFVSDELEEVGYALDPNTKLIRHGKNYVVSAHKIRNYDAQGNPNLSNNITTFLVSKDGKVIKALRQG